MLIKSLSNEKGITLLEVLAASVLFVVIMAISLSVFTNVLEDFKVGTERSKLYKEAQKIEAILVDTVRKTGISPNGNFYLEIDDINPNRYIFHEAVDSNNLLIFELDGNRLLFTQEGQTFVLSEHITAFILKEEGSTNKKLIYTINLASSISGKQVEINLEDRFIYFPIWGF